MTLAQLLSEAKTQVLMDRLPDLQSRLIQAETEIESYIDKLAFTPETPAETASHLVREYTAKRYAKHMLDFMLAIIPEQAAKESEAIRAYLSAHSAVPYGGQLWAPSSGGPVIGAVCGNIIYGP